MTNSINKRAFKIEMHSLRIYISYFHLQNLVSIQYFVVRKCNKGEKILSQCFTRTKVVHKNEVKVTLIKRLEHKTGLMRSYLIL